MWEFFSPVTKAHFQNDVNNFDPVSFNGETLGAYAYAESRKMNLVIISSSDQEAAGVVVISGSVTREGSTEEDAFAMPVRIVDGETTIELFSDASYPEAKVPEIGAYPTPTLRPRPTFEVIVDDSKSSEVVFSLTGLSAGSSSQSASEYHTASSAAGSRAVYSWTPEEDLLPGSYVITFVNVGEAGGLSASSELFTVE